MRYVIYLFLIGILVSLGSALFYLFKDGGTSTRNVKALTLRVALSVTLFILLMLGYQFGILPQR